MALADLGYLCLEELPVKQALGQYFVRRDTMRTEILTLEGEPLDLLAWLSQVGTEGERWVLLGKQARLPVVEDYLPAGNALGYNQN